MSLDDIDEALIQPVFSRDASADLGMRPLDVVIHRLAEIMQESSLQSEGGIGADELCDRLGEVCHFF